MSVTRYYVKKQYDNHGNITNIERDDLGDWVKYEDHAGEINKLVKLKGYKSLSLSYRSEVEKLQARIAELEGKQQWISVDDEKPLIFHEVLIYPYADMYGERKTAILNEKGEWETYVETENTADYVKLLNVPKYWMEKPFPPEQLLEVE